MQYIYETKEEKMLVVLMSLVAWVGVEVEGQQWSQLISEVAAPDLTRPSHLAAGGESRDSQALQRTQASRNLLETFQFNFANMQAEN